MRSAVGAVDGSTVSFIGIWARAEKGSAESATSSVK